MLLLEEGFEFSHASRIIHTFLDPPHGFLDLRLVLCLSVVSHLFGIISPTDGLKVEGKRAPVLDHCVCFSRFARGFHVIGDQL